MEISDDYQVRPLPPHLFAIEQGLLVSSLFLMHFARLKASFRDFEAHGPQPLLETTPRAEAAIRRPQTPFFPASSLRVHTTSISTKRNAFHSAILTTEEVCFIECASLSATTGASGFLKVGKRSVAERKGDLTKALRAVATPEDFFEFLPSSWNAEHRPDCSLQEHSPLSGGIYKGEFCDLFKP